MTNEPTASLRARAITSRSARLQTVRATCNWAAAGWVQLGSVGSAGLSWYARLDCGGVRWAGWGWDGLELELAELGWAGLEWLH